MILELEAMFYDMLGNSFVTSHLEKKIKFDVVKSDKVGSKFKEAVKKEYNAKFLDDSEYVIRFAEPIAENPTDDEEKEDTDNKDNQEGDENKDAENGEEETTDKEEVNESIKVQDLTSSMLSTPKGTKTKTTSKKVSKSVSKKCTTESDCDDKEDEKKDTKKKEVKTEAETEATGDELKNKVKKAIVRTFNIQDANKVELNDLPDFIEGYNVYFTKLSIKSKEENSEG